MNGCSREALYFRVITFPKKMGKEICMKWEGRVGLQASGCCASEHLNVEVVFLYAMLLSSIDLRLESQPVIEEFESEFKRYVRTFTFVLRCT